MSLRLTLAFNASSSLYLLRVIANASELALRIYSWPLPHRILSIDLTGEWRREERLTQILISSRWISSVRACAQMRCCKKQGGCESIKASGNDGETLISTVDEEILRSENQERTRKCHKFVIFNLSHSRWWDISRTGEDNVTYGAWTPNQFNLVEIKPVMTIVSLVTLIKSCHGYSHRKAKDHSSS